jgi:hypothetical protein
VLALLPTVFRLRRENARKAPVAMADTITHTDITAV